MVATDYATITTQDREIELSSTNELLLTYPPATGVKTGTTPGAGPSLVASAAAGDEAYVSVILDAREDRIAASIRALEHGFAAYDRRGPVAEGEQYVEANGPNRRGERVGLVAKESVKGLVSVSPEIEREARVFEDLPGSAKPGTTLGEVVVEEDGEALTLALFTQAPRRGVLGSSRVRSKTLVVTLGHVAVLSLDHHVGGLHQRHDPLALL